jgi:Ca2+-binding RTX toxin-like protein
MKKLPKLHAVITGSPGDDVLIGTPDPDTISGGDGSDTLIGNGGADVLIGGTGNDYYRVEEAADQVIEALGEGTDTVYAVTSYALAGGSEVENLIALDLNSTAALDLTGNEYANALRGNAGVNTLIGGGGADTLIGGAGNDYYRVEEAADRVIEASGEGTDTVYAVTSYALFAGSEVENLIALDLNSTAALNLTGNEYANALRGNAGDNILDGGLGADTLIGGGGIDTLIGGAGADVLFGGTGNDYYRVEDATDRVVEALGEGTDTVYAVTSYALEGGSEVENLIALDLASTAALNLTGNEFANALRGNAGVNTLIGGGGADTLFGGAGNDYYRVEEAADQVIEASGEGTDTVYAVTSYALFAGSEVENLIALDPASTAALNLTGNEYANALRGNAGANILDGGLGADTLIGDAGADTFAFTTALGGGNVDAITDFAHGTDKILLGGVSGQPFFTLATGALRSGTLVIGTAALDANDYLIYNSGTGALLYDADGVGGQAAVQFATLSTGLNLTEDDFIVSGLANNATVITSGATASIAENTSASTVVYQVAASDADGDRITYSLSGADASLLSIDANGAVRLNASADFETKNSYVFNVVASDSGSATTKAVTLTITDVPEGSTPTIQENVNNDTRQTAQTINPAIFAIADNPNLYNDDLASASILGSISTPNDDPNGSISVDTDWYSITLTAGQQLILDVDGTNGLDSFLSLFDGNGTLIGTQDDLISPDAGSNPPFSHNTDSLIIFRAATSGTYYFQIKSFVDEDTTLPTSRGTYTLNVSINSTPATAAQIMAEDVQALISGASWNHNGPAFNLTYGFPSQASYYPQTFDEVHSAGGSDPTPTFIAFSAQQQAATRSLLGLVANVTQITFTENTTQGDYTVAGTAANANLRYARSSEVDPGAAYAYYPTNVGPSSVGGSAWFNVASNNANFNSPARGNYAWMGILHETGHALGLKHGHEFPLAISANHDSVEYSVMTYRSFPGDDINGYNNEQWGYAQTLMMLDIAALQKIYGSANYNFNSGNSVYTWNATTGEMSINGVGQGAPGNGDGVTDPTENRVFMTVWDGNGEDTYDLSNYTNSIIDLRPGEWTTTAGAQLANLGSNHMARGNVANALLFEGDTRSAIENAIGGNGSDSIVANLVANKLTGNLGTDTFKWLSTGDAGTGSLADTVTDFVRGADKIDFASLDANPATAARDAFTFIGTSAFHNVAGEVRYDVTSGSAHIFADVDGNGTADMEIILTNVNTLASSDFFF